MCGVIKTATEFCELILRWDELADSVKAEIAEMLRLPRSLYGSRQLLLSRVNRKTTLPDR